MAGLPYKLIAQVAFKAGGDVFHQLLAKKPQHLANVTPGKVQACDLHQGNYGTDGSIIQWKYTLDGGSGNEAVMGMTEGLEGEKDWGAVV
ncbi:UNVERIFIED_CONTAM: MLP-like protein 28 [Sesamum angustifolium]|uniref:MLP-like protein 28 n=1 Tax=Sesamum angustifolium TaxID=2727405 RepID=A0AAW2MR93_9LAMI